ncbi:hypothetical protein NEDG_01666 [Nematocida displodere]|uniref:Uncharacterized protein n=1 Tax=Nematocida displodere TaxID=1805483 RepID=A0A177EH08_9MICR|nr:hypothetical protein NEDG_01666 [Nematocida displodere]
MGWRIESTKSEFFLEDVIATGVRVVPPVGERILLGTCTLTGHYLTAEHSILFLETVSVVLGVDVACLDAIEYSVLLPSNLPPSYNGSSVAVVYALNVAIQTRTETVTNSILLKMLTRTNKCTFYDSKISLSGRYVSVEEGVDQGPREKYMHTGIVSVLREAGALPVEWMNAKESPSSVNEAYLRLGRLNLKERARELLVAQKESNLHPLPLYKALRKKVSGSAVPRASYTIKKGGRSTATILVVSAEQAPPHWLLTLSVRFLESAKVLKLTLSQVEEVGGVKDRVVFYYDERSVSNCTSLLSYVPLNKSKHPKLATNHFSTFVEVSADIDGSVATIEIDRG